MKKEDLEAKTTINYLQSKELVNPGEKYPVKQDNHKQGSIVPPRCAVDTAAGLGNQIFKCFIRGSIKP